VNESGTSDRVALVRRIALAAWLTVSSIQLAAWVLICVIGVHLINPFWIWGTVGGGLVVGAVWWATRPRSRS
jgi:hypothetical protein